ncbi:MAG: hypothetical protein R3185_06370 [Candidatus Thermoplasmatota archaeon]|nr:hypothetical protein [Candidatus Thermoplasmatota archaeon]
MTRPGARPRWTALALLVVVLAWTPVGQAGHPASGTQAIEVTWTSPAYAASWSAPDGWACQERYQPSLPVRLEIVCQLPAAAICQGVEVHARQRLGTGPALARASCQAAEPVAQAACTLWSGDTCQASASASEAVQGVSCHLRPTEQGHHAGLLQTRCAFHLG